jgi:hypothetical protein
VEQLLYGSHTLSWLSADARTAFIETGFARFRKITTKKGEKSRLLVFDEPLAVLAALKWIETQTSLSMFEHLHRNIDRHNPHRNGFEAYLSFYIREVFKESPNLGTVFTFRKDFVNQRLEGNLTWPDQKFSLVVFCQDSKEADPQILAATPSGWASSNMGLRAESVEVVLEWLTTNRNRYIFCFPPESMGPDLLFFIRSERSQKLVLVALQAKAYKNVAKRDLLHGILSVTPEFFWKQKYTKASVVIF